MEPTLPKTEVDPKAAEMFEKGETSSRVAQTLRIAKAAALDMKKVWMEAKAPAKPKKEKPAKEPKA